MLNWGSPGAFWLILAVLPIVICYFLRMFFRRQPVSSTYLWSRLRRPNQGGRFLQRRSVGLLLLQILAALFAVLAIAEPVWLSRQTVKPGRLFLVDVSASMATLEDPASRRDRLTEAKRILERELRRGPSDWPVMIMACDTTARPMGEPVVQPGQAQAIIKQLTVSGGGFDEVEVAKAVGAWLTRQTRPWQACLITDGGLELGGQRLAGIFTSGFRVITVGKTGNNLGVTGLRIDFEQKTARFLIHNGWATPQPLKITLSYNQEVLQRQVITVAAGVSGQQLPLQGPLRAGYYTVEIVHPQDSLASDNRYILAVNPPRKVRILLIGPANPFLKAALTHPLIEYSQRSQLTEGELAGGDWDMVIADRVKLPRGLRCNVLTFGQIPAGAPLVRGPAVRGKIVAVDGQHPLLRFGDWQALQVTQGFAVTIKPGARSLATVEGRPLVATWEEAGYHRVAWGTDLFGSNLGLAGAFPVFLQNMVRWTVPQWGNPLAYNLTVGITAAISEPPTWSLPKRTGIAYRRLGRRVIIEPTVPGIAVWEDRDRRGWIAVNPPFSEADIAPRKLTGNGKAAKTSAGVTEQRRPLTEWALAALLVCLAIEWIIWRGVRLSRKE